MPLTGDIGTLDTRQSGEPEGYPFGIDSIEGTSDILSSLTFFLLLISLHNLSFLALHDQHRSLSTALILGK